MSVHTTHTTLANVLVDNWGPHVSVLYHIFSSLFSY